MAVFQRGRKPRRFLPAVTKNQDFSSVVLQLRITFLWWLFGKLRLYERGERLLSTSAEVKDPALCPGTRLTHGATAEYRLPRIIIVDPHVQAANLLVGKAIFPVYKTGCHVDPDLIRILSIPRCGGQHLQSKDGAFGLTPKEIK